MRRLTLILAMPLALGAADPSAPFAIEGGGAFYRLDDAVRALGDAGGTIVVASGRYPDCAVIASGDVTLRAATPSSAIFDGGTCEGKATLVARANHVTVDGLVFQDVRVPDRNGAGIRLESGDLTVTHSTFRNSEQGILTANDNAGTITVSWSTFSGLGGCPDGMCSHSIYVGDYGKLAVDHCRFERGTGGHYVKSRAATVAITDSSFDDSGGRDTNYMIDLPSGATGRITGNAFVQGPNKENHSAFIAVAAERRDHPSAGLTIENNDARFAPGVTWPSVFAADWSQEPLRIGANVLAPRLKAFELR